MTAHHVPVKFVLVTIKSRKTTVTSTPPSSQLLYEHHTGKSASRLTVEAKATLLPLNEVELWLDHLATVTRNRLAGANKAAVTRGRSKKSAVALLCL